ncbi:MAG: helix-turn-helix domain-containing protein [Bacteroidota bacterium]
MEVITLQSEVYQNLVSKIDNLSQLLTSKHKVQPLSDTWLDISECCMLLKISKRTLQSYRDNKVLPYSQIAGKIYFKASDIEAHLANHYVKVNNRR